LPSLVRYGLNATIADERLRKRLLEIPLAFLEQRPRQQVHGTKTRVVSIGLKADRHDPARRLSAYGSFMPAPGAHRRGG
jgi:hypothetical protein